MNSETFFWQTSCKVASFPLVLDWMHECCVILHPDVFHFLKWRSTCLVAYFHISTSQKLRGNEIAILLLTLRWRENNKKLRPSCTNKTHVYSLLSTFYVLWLYVVTEKSPFLYAIFRILIRPNPKILQIFFL